MTPRGATRERGNVPQAAVGKVSANIKKGTAGDVLQPTDSFPQHKLPRLVLGVFVLLVAVTLIGCSGRNVSSNASSNLSLIPFGTYVGAAASSDSSSGSPISLTLNPGGTYSAVDGENAVENGTYSLASKAINFQSSDTRVGSYNESYYYAANISCLFMSLDPGQNMLALYLKK